MFFLTGDSTLNPLVAQYSAEAGGMSPSFVDWFLYMSVPMMVALLRTLIVAALSMIIHMFMGSVMAVLPRGAEEMLPSDPAELAEIGVEVLPEGTYLCMSRWSMPYEPEGIRAIVVCMDKHALQPIGNAFDFCYLDTTSYDESHQEDFCCIQIPVVLQM